MPNRHTTVEHKSTARTLGRDWVRLATVATYPPIRRFYQRLDYKECGSYPLFRFEVVAYE